MSLRWRIAIGFALVALATAAIIALATPPIVSQGFQDLETDNEGGPTPTPILVATDNQTQTTTPSPTVGPHATPTAVSTDDLGETGDGTGPTPKPGASASGVPTSTDGSWASPSPAPSGMEGPGESAEPGASGDTITNPIAVPAKANSTDAVEPGETSQPSSSPRPGASTPTTPDQAQQNTIMRILLAAAFAAAGASLLGLFAAGRLVRPLTRLEAAASAVAAGDLSRRSGLADRTDEFGQLGRTFDKMAAELQSADATRRQFLQDAAHELKTPLAVIEATSSAILDGVYAPEQRHLLTIRDQSRILARIVDDLRTISLAEGGHLPLERRPIDVRTVLDSVATGFEARAAASTIGIAVDGPAGLIADADQDRLRQMVGALVDNALRHTPAGGTVRLVAAGVGSVGPAVSRTVPIGKAAGPAAAKGVHVGKGAVSAGPQPGSPGSAATGTPLTIRISVEDTGPGISADALPRVFERFFQADQSRSRGTGTSGLGLSIVRALAEAHGGCTGAENCPDGGARLWIELPAIAAPPAVPPA